MTGWIVYERWNLERNRFFIDRWMNAAKAEKTGLQLVILDELSFGVRGNAPFLCRLLEEARPDFVVMRCQHPLLSAHLEAMGIACHNNARVADICNDKRKTHALFAGRLPMMDSACIGAGEGKPPFPLPLVVKASHGCGGRQVSLATNEAELNHALQKVKPDSAVLQPLCDEPGRDLRVYVLGSEVVGAFLRYQDKDFRSNLGLGGGTRPVEMDKTIRSYVDIVLSEFDVSLVGIDFIFHQGQPVLNEIEDAVGTRMLYQHTGRDIAREYLRFILSGL